MSDSLDDLLKTLREPAPEGESPRARTARLAKVHARALRWMADHLEETVAGSTPLLETAEHVANDARVTAVACGLFADTVGGVATAERRRRASSN